MPNFLLTTSWDDGALEDLRLSELLAKYDIPATFYLPVKNPERKVIPKTKMKELSVKFEVGSHSYHHLKLTRLSRDELVKEISLGKTELQNILGEKVESFAYPVGCYNQHVKQVVGLAGFTYARTVRLFARGVSDKLLAPTTIHARDHHPLLYLGELAKLGRVGNIGQITCRWDELARHYLDDCLKRGGVFHLWGHSWEIEERGDWKRLQSVLAYIKRNTTKAQRKTNGELVKALSAKKKEYYENVDLRLYNASLRSSGHLFEAKFLRRVVGKFDKKSSLVLDVGCGRGRFAKLFKRASYVGVDFSGKLVDYARADNEAPASLRSGYLLSVLRREQNPSEVEISSHSSLDLRSRFSAEGDNKVRFVEASLADLAKKSWGKQDLIIIWGLFEDETNPYGEVLKLKKFVKPGTRIIFTLHNQDNLLFRLARLYRSISLREPFPYSSFTKGFIKKEGGEKAAALSFKQKVHRLGPTLVVILDKK